MQAKLDFNSDRTYRLSLSDRSLSLPRLRGEHGAKGHERRERVGEVERVGVDAAWLGLRLGLGLG